MANIPHSGACKHMKAEDIARNLELLGQELEKRGVTGEILITGGAFMLLVIKNRDTTKDIDAYFATEPQAIREAALILRNAAGVHSAFLPGLLLTFIVTI